MVQISRDKPHARSRISRQVIDALGPVTTIHTTTVTFRTTPLSSKPSHGLEDHGRITSSNSRSSPMMEPPETLQLRPVPDTDHNFCQFSNTDELLSSLLVILRKMTSVTTGQLPKVTIVDGTAVRFLMPINAEIP
ncbi:hypothetical protein TNCV_4914351 [Trichonephila clavipes]|nr:hypothetical protein TNCV_4914351 [Trichonephila clavipes]